MRENSHVIAWKQAMAVVEADLEEEKKEERPPAEQPRDEEEE